MRTKNLLNETLKDISSFLNIDIEQARRIKKLISGDISPDTFDSVQKWVSQCYNDPSLNEKIMEALNEILGFHGFIEIRNEENWIDSYYQDINFLYCNSGDTYHGTILYDCENDKYFLGSWGDIVERLNI